MRIFGSNIAKKGKNDKPGKKIEKFLEAKKQNNF